MSDKEVTKPAEYRPIKDFPGYRVGDDGSVWSQRKMGNSRVRMSRFWHKLNPTLAGKGYPHIFLCLDGSVFPKYVHVLVLETFIGPRPKGMECCHNDGTPTNNRLENLRWDTQTNNNADKVRHGTMLCGELIRGSKLSDSDVRNILACSGKETTITTAKRFKVSRPIISNIQTGKRWKHISGIRRLSLKLVGEDTGMAKLNESQVRTIESLKGTESRRATAKRYGITVTHVGRIQTRTTWSHLWASD